MGTIYGERVTFETVVVRFDDCGTNLTACVQKFWRKKVGHAKLESIFHKASNPSSKRAGVF